MTKSAAFLSVLLLLSLPAQPAMATLRAAAVKVDITPQTPQWLIGYDARQSTGVHDKIFHRILAIDDGKTRFYLIASDICLFSPSLYDEVADRLQQQLGIARESFWWTVTHTHSAPELGPPTMYKVLLGRSDHEWSRDYTKQTIDSLVEGIKDATAKLEPASLEIGTGESFANINRRAKDVDGTVTLGMNPDGPADRQIGILALRRPDRSLIATVANFAMHGTVLNGQNLLISGDAPGIVADYVEQKTGATMLYINSAAGNMAPIYSVYANPSGGHLSQFRVLLGDRILAALQSSVRPPKGRLQLSLSEITFETPLKAGLSWPEELRRYAGVATVRLPVRFLKLGDTVIWSAPIEMFCEMALEIRRASPFQNTFFFGYANGWFGYLPTQAAFREGGYEPKTSPFTGSAEQDLIRTVCAKIASLK